MITYFQTREEIEQLKKDNAELVAACRAMLPVIQYILTNGWSEAPPLLGTTFDEFKANELAVEALANCNCREGLDEKV